MKTSVLTSDQARAFYDRFGARQDKQAFYEDSALDALIAHSAFGKADAVFEFGCGTGRLASRLIEEHMPETATYLGCDVSKTMIELATGRLAPHASRAKVLRTNGSIAFPLSDDSVDRVVSTFVLDLLSEQDIRAFFAEAARVLVPHGKLSVAGLTNGNTPVSRMVSRAWKGLFRVRASAVGGCRPVELSGFVDRRQWDMEYQGIVTPYGLASEVLVCNRAR